jgi:hypothetical protein
MDPLSIITATIALTEVTSLGLEKFRDIYHASSDICSLINEVSDLKLILGEAKQSIAQQKNYPQRQGVTDKINELLLPANERLSELETLIETQLAVAKPAGTKPARLAWLRHKSKVTRILGQLKQTRLNLTALWSASQQYYPP